MVFIGFFCWVSHRRGILILSNTVILKAVLMGIVVLILCSRCSSLCILHLLDYMDEISEKVGIVMERLSNKKKKTSPSKNIVKTQKRIALMTQGYIHVKKREKKL